MKRIAFILASSALFAVLALGLAGCDQADGNPRIGVALFSVDDSFASAARRSLEAKAQGRAQLSVLDGQNRQSVQNEQIDAMFADKAKSVIVSPVDLSTMEALVLKAKSANVPIVFFSRRPSTSGLNMWDKAYFVGVKTDESDALRIEILADYWKKHPEADKNHDGKLQYVLLSGGSDLQAAPTGAENRKRAFDAAGIQAVKLGEANVDGTRAEAQAKMTDVITQLGIKRIEAVLCDNDEVALGAIAALKVANPSGKDELPPIVGAGGTRDALDAIADGSLLGTVSGDAEGMGRAAFDLAYALASGKDPKAAGWPLTDGKYVLLPYQKVTSDNYKTFAN
jgi:methyl-galactoside transport system substrate-binding protein